MRKPKARPTPRPRLLAEELEPRILYSADAAALLGLNGGPGGGPGSALVRELEPAPLPGRLAEAQQPSAAQAEVQSAREIIFIDSRVPDAMQLADQLMQQRGGERQFDIVLLSADEDGVAQINEILANERELAAIHIISHGSSGAIEVGSSRLDAARLAVDAQAVARWGQALGADGDLLLYGCEVAQDAAGQAFVQNLARLTGADVAASSDKTGSASLRGNWTLEFATGAIHTQHTPGTFAQMQWEGVLSWNTFLGSGTADNTSSIAVDGSGNTYISGWSSATWGAPVRAYSSGSDAYVAKLDSSGNLVWNTFLGGAGGESGISLAIDGSGNVYVAGNSDATWGTPVRAYSGASEAFVAKLNSSGTLVWNTFLGGAGGESGLAVAVDGSGNVYAAGTATATWGSPVQAFSGAGDAFAAKLNSSGSLTWNTFLGAAGVNDDAYDVAADASGNVYLTGSSSGTWGSPVRAYSSGSDAYAAKLNSGGGLTWNTFLGTSGSDLGNSVAVDGAGDVYVAGKSAATWGSPVRAYTLGGDGFVARLNGSGSLTWNTFLGGSATDDANSIAVGGSGSVYVSGSSAATWGAPLQAYSSGTDAMAAELNGTGSLIWNTFRGGSGSDFGQEVAADSSGSVYVAGYSDATWGSPVRPYSLGTDGFVAKLASGPAIDLDANDSSGATGTSFTNRFSGAGAVAVADSDATVSDPLSATLVSITVTLTNRPDGAAEVLAANTAGTSITANYVSGTGVLTLSGADTLAHYQQVLRTVTYNNVAGSPNVADRIITFVANDGSNTSAAATTTLKLANLPPVNTVPGVQTANYIGTVVFSAANGNAISVSDPDAGTSPLQVTLTGTQGALTLSGTTGLTFSTGDGSADATMVFSGTAANINAALNGSSFNGDPFRTSGTGGVQIVTNDLGNTGLGGALSDTDSVTIDMVPLGTPYMITGTYTGNGGTLNVTGLGFQPDVVIVKQTSGNKLAVIKTSSMAGAASKEMTGASATSTGSITSLGADGFTVVNGDNVANVNAATYTYIAFKASSGVMQIGSYAGTGVAGNAVTGLGFRPEMVFVLDNSNQAPVFRSSADADSYDFTKNDYVSAVTSLDAAGFTLGTDQRANKSGDTYNYIAFNAIPGFMNVGSYTGDATDNRNIAGVGFSPEWLMVQSASGNDPAVHHTEAQGALTDVTNYFTGTTSTNPGNRIQQLQADGFQVGSDADVNAAATAFSYAAWRQETGPTITAIANQTTPEDTPLGPIAFTIGDAETAAGSLFVTAGSSNPALLDVSNIVFGGSGANRTLTLTPTANASGTVAVTVYVSDGQASALTVFTLTVTAVNDAPTATITPATYAATEQVALTLHGTGLSIADVDAGGAGVRATISVTSGILTAAAGTTGATVTGSGTASVTLDGTLTQINNLLAGSLSGTLSYTANSDTPAASATLTLNASDLGNTGSGGTLTGLDTATINIAAVNDAPTATITPASYAVTEQVALVLKNTGLAISDPDAAAGSMTVTLSVTEGTLTATAGGSGAVVSNSGTASVTITGTVAQINNLLGTDATSTVSYTNNSDAPSASATLTLQVNDNGNTGGGSLTNADTATINTSAVNDPPVNTAPSGQYTALNTAVVFSSGNGNPISISDADAGANPVQVTLTVGNGTLTLGGITGLSFTGGANGSATMTFTGTASAINTALNGTSYAPATNYRGLDTLQIVTSDLGNAGTGGAQSDSDTLKLHVGALVVTNTDGGAANGNTSSISALAASDGGDGISLREAIIAANNTAGADTIHFAITGTGVHTIAPTSALPTITSQVTIDASTDDSFAANGNRPAIILEGTNAGAGTDGLVLTSTADGSVIRGLVIRDFGNDGIVIQAGSDNNVIAGNYIGRLTATGTDAGAGTENADDGIEVLGSNNTIGGTVAADRNVISGNASTGINLEDASGNTVAGNYIGLTAAGTASLGNGNDGVLIRNGASGNTIGGATPAHRNVIAGNSDGVQIGGTGVGANDNNVVIGNYIGTDFTGTLDLGNTDDGVDIDDASLNNQILNNLIAGNTSDGIDLAGGGTPTGTVIQGNLIGTAANGSSPLGNSGHGIRIGSSGTAYSTTIGGTTGAQGNTIAFNAKDGIFVDVTSTSVAILGNSIYGNTEQGVDLGAGGVTANDAGDADTGANNLQNFPVLASANADAAGTTIVGTINSNANTNLRIEFFANRPSIADAPNGEGERYLGFVTVTTDVSGNASVNTVLSNVWVNSGDRISATATNLTTNDTSEFAANVTATSTGIIVVDTTSDVSDGTTTSIINLGNARGADGRISLREAIIAANNTGGADTIRFQIAGTGVHTIAPTAALPTITEQLTIDASTDDSFAANGNRPAIVLDGNDGNFAGLVIGATGDGSTIKGLVIRDFGTYGLHIAINSDGNTIVGNYIGALSTGGVSAGAGENNGDAGIYIQGSNNTIGGASPALRNVISGNSRGIFVLNASGNTIQGNFIGTDAAGTTLIGNFGEGIQLRGATNTQIGGTAASAGNVLAGAEWEGIWLWDGTTGTVVEGNFIGTDITGTLNLGNVASGINIGNYGPPSTGNRIGGTAAGAANLIAFNGRSGVEVDQNSGGPSTGNPILGNRFHANAGIAIDLDGFDADPSSAGVTANDAGDADVGGNNRQNFPVLTVAATTGAQVTFTGTLNSTASTQFRIEFFASTAQDGTGYGEGQRYLGFANVTTDGSGNTAISATLTAAVAAGEFISATATQSNAGFTVFTDTSEFAQNVIATAGTAAPVVSTTGSALAYTENAAATAVDSALSVSDADSVNLIGATVTISANYANGQDVLAFANQLGITGSWNAATGVMALSGTTTVANYQAALRAVTYVNTSDSPSNLTRTVSLVVNDGTASSTTATRDISVTPVNDAPTLGNGTLAAVAEDTAGPPGQALGTIFAGQFADADSGASFAGVAVVGNTANAGTQGTWEYSTNSGSNWFAIGTVADDSTALAISSSTLVRFVPVANYSGTPPALTVRGLDNSYVAGFSTTAGSETRVSVDTTTNGGSTAIAAASASLSTSITAVNDAPVLAVIGNQAVNEGTTLTFTATATDADLPSQTLSFSLDAPSLALGMSINASTGVFSWTPSEAQGGLTPSVTITVTDNGAGSLSDSETFTITVGDTNLAPVLAPIGNQVASEGVNLSFTASASDPDLPGQTLSYSLDAPSLALGMSINSSTGVFSWTPSEAQGGLTPSVTITVTDNGAGSLSDSETFTITVGDTNLAPVLAAIGNQVVSEGVSLSFTASASDPDLAAQTLTYSLDAPSLALGMSINSSTGVFSWTPSEAQGGLTPSVTITVTDNGAGSLTDSETFTITVGDTNLAPVLAPIGNQVVNEGVNLSFTASATDPDLPSQTLSYSLDAPSLALGMSINSATGVFSWTPSEAQGGLTPSVTITVTDNGAGSLSDSETFTITVGDTNLAPVLAAIGNQVVSEGVSLSFTASATDPDLPAQTLTYSLDAPSLALGMSINSSTGVFSWTPSEAQGGLTPSVTITVTDNGAGSLSDSETFTITVGDTNLAPLLAPIGNQPVSEGANLSFTASATDPDLAAQTLSFSLDAPSLALGMSINSSTGVFSWTPSEAQGGLTPSVTITVTDNGAGSLSDSETFTITVGDTNLAPVLAPIGNQVVNEGLNLSFTASATDPDLPGQTLTYSLDAPSLALGMSINSSTGVFSWTPSEAQGGLTPSVTITVTDNGAGSLSDSETFTITVGDTNLAPLLAPIGNQVVNEGVNLSFTASATDPDLAAQTLTFSLDAPSLALGMSINSSTGVFSWTPSEAQGGLTPSVTITVTDNGAGSLSDSETFTITVGDTNLAPVLAPIGNQVVNEGVNLSFTVSATDPDLAAQTLTYSLDAPSLALGMSINSSTGVFSWTPSEAQGGLTPSVTITVTDNGAGSLSDSETFTITVGDTNLAPVLAPIGNQVVNEGVNLSFTATATDADLPSQALSYSLDAPSLALGMSINSSTGVFSWTPSEAQGGLTPSVTITVTDNGAGSLSDSETFTITVGDTNLAPVLAPIGNQTVNEGVNLSFTASATDPDLAAQTLTYSLDAPSLALGMSINASSGVFSWTPSEAQGGLTPSVTITVTDNGAGSLSDSETFTITVGDTNLAPVLAPIGNQVVNEGLNLSFTASATDPDLPGQTLTYSLDAPSLALGMSINSSTGVFSWTPSEAQGGLTPSVTITVTDNGAGSLSDSETFTITVGDTNLAPVLAPIGNQVVNEGVNLSFTASATDPDLAAQTLTYSLDAPSLALGMSINSSTGVFSWTPSEAQGGLSPSVTITVTDNGAGSLSDSETFTITVGDTNLAPVLAPIGNRVVNEGVNLSFTASATDPDLPSQTLSYSLDAPSLALGMSINSSTGVFSWTPSEAQGGLTPSVTITVTDNGAGSLSDSETFTITVGDTNLAPVLAPISNQVVNEGVNLSFTASATDPDLAAQTLTFSLDAPSLALGMSINSSTGVFSWTPSEAQGGLTPSVTITVTDNGAGSLSDSETFTITVGDTNLAPVLAPIGNQVVNEGVNLSFTASATDPDLPGQTLTYSLDAPSLALGMSINSSTGVFSWTPSEAQGGLTPSVTITVTDNGAGSLSDSETFTITVGDTNLAPVLAPIGNQVASEGVNLSFTALASDPDLAAQTLTFSLDAPSLALGMSINASTGAFSWTPNEAQGGLTPSITITVTDNGAGSLSDSATFTITVDDTNLAPALAPIGNRAVSEGVNLSFTASATDPDLPSQTLSYSLDAPSLALGMSINSSTGVFSWTPSEAQGGLTPSVTITVTDNGTGSLSDSETFTITVGDTNLAPVLAPIGNRVASEGVNLSFTASATDADLPSQTLSYSLDAPSLALGMSINSSTGVFSWTPSEAQGGLTPSVTITVTDNGAGSLSDSETFTITVGDTNLAPVLAPIGNRVVNEGVNLSFTASATDADLPSQTLSYSLDAPSIALGMSINSSTGVFSWTPSEAQGGLTPSVTITVTDNGAGSLSDSETFTITVGDTNIAPVLAPIGNRVVNEGVNLSFTASATDPDLAAQTLTFSLDAPSLALGMSINASTGVFSWTPSEAQGGLTPSVTITVTDNGTGSLSDSETFTITVGDTNLAPVLAPIGNQVASEGVILSFTASAADSDLPSQTLSYSLDAPSLALGMSINSSTGVFNWTPSEAQGGLTPSVTITVTDNGAGSLSDSETFTITVGDTNLAPVLAPIGNRAVSEGVNLSFTASATDPDLPSQALSYSLDAPSLALGMSINSSTGVFSWTPSEAQGGLTPSVTITVTDNGAGSLSDSETFTITVGDTNLAPVLAPIGNQVASEGVNLSFTASAADPDLPGQTLTFSLDAPSLALGMSINSSTGVFSWTPSEAQGGTAPSVTITVTDNGAGSLSDSETFTITVGDTNLAPVLAPIGNRVVNEGVNLSFTASATDPDLPSQTLTFSLDAPSLALGMSINSSTGVFSWTPSEAQGGLSPSVTITVTDNGAGSLSGSETFTITVGDTNLAPVLAPIGNQVVNEGVNLSFTATATDADLPSQTLSYSLDAPSLALGMSINSTTGVFSWTPSEAQGGLTPSVTITVTDNGAGSLSDSETFTITVGDTNLAPVLAPIGNQVASEGVNLSFTASATDPDLPSQTLSYSLDAPSLALGMSINSSTGVFSWTPSEAQGGLTPSVTITVTDNGAGSLSDSETFTITVGDTNLAPVLAPIGNRVVNEGVNLSFTASATDPDLPSQTLSYSLDAPSLALGMSINASTGVFSWTPSEAQGGLTPPVTITVTDNGAGSLSDSETFTITVGGTNLAPVLAAIANQSVTEGATLSFTASAADPDLPAQSLSYSLDAASLALGMSLNASTGAFSWTPTEAQSGLTSSITITVADNGTGKLADSQTFTISVTAVNDAPVSAPVTLTAIAEDSGARLITQAELLANASDIDGPSLSATGLAISAGAGRLVDNGNGTWTYTPAANDDSAVSFAYTVTDGGLTAVGRATLDITPVNHAPAITSNGGGASASLTVVEAGTAVTTVIATDADLPAQALTYSIAGGADAARFTLDGSTGALGFGTAPDFEVPSDADANNVYELIVRVFDGALGSTQAISVTVLDANEPPRAADSSAKLAEGAAVSIDLAATASDVDAGVNGVIDRAGAVLVSGPSHGTLLLRADGTATYAHDGGETTSDSFTYTLRDAAGATSNLATVRFSVTPVNDAPMLAATPLALSGGQDLLLSSALLRMDDPDSAAESLSFAVSEVRNARFEWVAAPGGPISQFTQADVAAGRVRFVSTSSTDAPTFRVLAFDGQAYSAEISAVVEFTPTAQPRTGDAASNPLAAAPDAAGSTGSTGSTDVAAVAAAADAGAAAAAAAPEPAAAPTDSGIQVAAPLLDTGGGSGPTETPRGRLEVAAPRPASLEPEAQRVRSPGNSANGSDFALATITTTDDYFIGTLQVQALNLSLPDQPGLRTGPPSEESSVTPQASVETSASLTLSETTQVTGLALTAGTVWWALRAGGLLSGLLLSLPAWRHADLLAVLPDDDGQDDWDLAEDDEAARDEHAVGRLFEPALEGDTR